MFKKQKTALATIFHLTQELEKIRMVTGSSTAHNQSLCIPTERSPGD